jgi:hypothetical protein
LGRPRPGRSQRVRFLREACAGSDGWRSLRFIREAWGQPYGFGARDRWERAMGRWTAVVEWRPGEREEIDVTARNEEHARRLAERMLKEDYDEGRRIVVIHPLTVNALLC